MNVADFADFAGSPATARFATAEKLRRVAESCGYFTAAAIFRTFPQTFRKRQGPVLLAFLSFLKILSLNSKVNAEVLAVDG